jgi:hypothetical protein
VLKKELKVTCPPKERGRADGGYWGVKKKHVRDALISIATDGTKRGTIVAK